MDGWDNRNFSSTPHFGIVVEEPRLLLVRVKAPSLRLRSLCRLGSIQSAHVGAAGAQSMVPGCIVLWNPDRYGLPPPLRTYIQAPMGLGNALIPWNGAGWTMRFFLWPGVARLPTLMTNLTQLWALWTIVQFLRKWSSLASRFWSRMSFIVQHIDSACLLRHCRRPSHFLCLVGVRRDLKLMFIPIQHGFVVNLLSLGSIAAGGPLPHTNWPFSQFLGSHPAKEGSSKCLVAEPEAVPFVAPTCDLA